MRLRRTAAAVWLLLLVGAVGVAAAQNPFVGTWKLNQEKSHLAGATMTFGPAQGEAIQLTANGTNYSFRVDGNQYRMATGDLAIWAQADPSTWTTTYKTPDGKLLDTDTWTLSPDGATLTVVTNGVKPAGEKYTNTAVYARTSGSSGQIGSLIGSWKSTDVKLSSPNDLTIAAYGLGGLSLKINALKASALVNFGGKDVAPVGPTIPPGLTIALFRIGPSSFRLVKKISGTVTYSARYEVSADGQTMTETGNSPGDPSEIAVWEKQ